jgi:hypothetical protein
VILSDWVVKSLTGSYDTSRHLRFAVKPTQGFLRQYAEMVDQVRRNEDGVLTQAEANSFAEQLQAEYVKIERAKHEDQILSEPITMTMFSEYFETVLTRAMQTSEPLTVLSQMYGPQLAPLMDSIFKTPQFYPREREVYMLINELDFSGGDATPASLQDYGRAKLVGVGAGRTAGAGGTVEQVEIRGQLEASLGLTTSLMVRTGNRTVEGSGVHADGIVIPFTRQDVIDGNAQIFERIADRIAADQAQGH